MIYTYYIYDYTVCACIILYVCVELTFIQKDPLPTELIPTESFFFFGQLSYIKDFKICHVYTLEVINL